MNIKIISAELEYISVSDRKGGDMADVYDYLCVSSRDQNEDRQRIALQEKNIFIDK